LNSKIGSVGITHLIKHYNCYW